MIYPHWLWQIVITKQPAMKGHHLEKIIHTFKGQVQVVDVEKKHLKTLQNIKYSTPLASICSSSPLHLPILDVYMFRNIQLILSCTDSQFCWLIPTFQRTNPKRSTPQNHQDATDVDVASVLRAAGSLHGIWRRCTWCFAGHWEFLKFCTNQWPFQEPIHWRYLPYIRPMFQAYAREYPHKIWPYMVQYLHFRILKFPLKQGCLFSYLLAID